jgi:Holliday junction resolvasome RuvABC endonuclease subunit
MVFLGIDPGKGGGIAAVDEAGKVLGVEKMPGTEAELLATLRQWPDGVTRAVLEFVRSSPQMGVTSAFSFGRGYGGLRMALVASGIPFDEVVPAKWQQAMQCRSKGDKNTTKRRAQELFPSVRCNHFVSDALLLAEYCRRFDCGLRLRLPPITSESASS